MADNLYEKYKNQLRSIFDELISIFDRFDDNEIQNFLDEFEDLDYNIKKVIRIIENYWNITSLTIVEDYITELKRQEKNQMEIPDIPTYQIRFALEEGSWIIFLRDYLPKMLTNQFNHLLNLEETIWQTGARSKDELSYYLLELDQIGEEWIKPLVKLWIEEHDYSKFEDINVRLTASIFGTNMIRGTDIFDGVIRLLSSKLNDFPKPDQTIVSSWELRSIEVINILNKFLEKKEFTEHFEYIILTFMILQHKVIKLSQKIHEINIANPKATIDVIEDIGWDTLDVNNPESFELFTDNVLLALFERPEENPISPTKGFLKQVIDGIQVNSKKYNDIVDNIIIEIDKQTSTIIDEYEREKAIVSVIEEYLPLELIKLKESLN